MFCYTIIERNNRQFIPVVRSGTGGDLVQTCTNPLDSFFPFDPYVLKRYSLKIHNSFLSCKKTQTKSCKKLLGSHRSLSSLSFSTSLVVYFNQRLSRDFNRNLPLLGCKTMKKKQNPFSRMEIP